jgi:hypothetical protein
MLPYYIDFNKLNAKSKDTILKILDQDYEISDIYTFLNETSNEI